MIETHPGSFVRARLMCWLLAMYEFDPATVLSRLSGSCWLWCFVFTMQCFVSAAKNDHKKFVK